MASPHPPGPSDLPAVARLAAAPLDGGDDHVMAVVARAWDTVDPVPPDLVERAVFAVALDEVMAEVARIQRLPSGDLAGVRSTQVATSMTFTVQGSTMMVTIGDDEGGTHRLDGWVTSEDTSGGDFTVVLHLPDATRSVDATGGRFAFDRVPGVMVQFVVEDRATGAAVMMTQAVQL
jgi:hypothetical protein